MQVKLKLVFHRKLYFQFLSNNSEILLGLDFLFPLCLHDQGPLSTSKFPGVSWKSCIRASNRSPGPSGRSQMILWIMFSNLWIILQEFVHMSADLSLLISQPSLAKVLLSGQRLWISFKCTECAFQDYALFLHLSFLKL